MERLVNECDWAVPLHLLRYIDWCRILLQTKIQGYNETVCTASLFVHAVLYST